MKPDVRSGVVGATGAVGGVTLSLLAERGFEEVRAFASARSAGSRVGYGERDLPVEEATPEALAEGDLGLCFFSVGTATSRELVPRAVSGGATVIDKSDAYRLEKGVPLVVAGVNDDAVGDEDRIVANPNCSALQLTCALMPLHEAAGLARVRLATYQSMSGAGDAGIERLSETKPLEADLAMDWSLEGDEGEYSEEYKLREETRKILRLPDLPLHATCMRVPVLVGHAQAVWVETELPLSPREARAVLAEAPHVRVADAPTPGAVAGTDEVYVGRIRRDPTAENVLAFLVVNDNLRKGAALNAVQIAEALLARNLPRPSEAVQRRLRTPPEPGEGERGEHARGGHLVDGPPRRVMTRREAADAERDAGGARHRRGYPRRAAGSDGGEDARCSEREEEACDERLGPEGHFGG
jgi:aspartate-semialdehyde dehydrogenase